jgi:hypothetical protein
MTTLLDDEERVERLLSALAAGNTVEVAASHAGVSATTFYKWQARGRLELDRIRARVEDGDADAEPVEEERPFAEFVERIDAARNRAEMRAVTLIRRWAEGFTVTETVTETRADGSVVTRVTERPMQSWQAAAWWLERTRPRQYGRAYRVDAPIPVEVSGQIEHQHEIEHTVTLAGVVSALREARGLPSGWHDVLDGAATELGPPDADAVHPPSPNGETDGAAPRD